MFWRFLFSLIALFWVTMNILLWRAEYGGSAVINSAVPVNLVWRRILDSPDDSSLNITRYGKRIGFCHLRTSVGERLSKLDEAPQNGVSVPQSGILFDGQVAMDEALSRLRFDGELLLTPDRKWEQFELRISRRPLLIEVHSVAAEQEVHLSVADEEFSFERDFSFSALRNPARLFSELAGPFAGGLAVGFDLPALTSSSTRVAPILDWNARSDTLMIGHESVHVYRLQTRIADSRDVTIYVSHAGEILKAELPDGVTLLHEKLTRY